MHKKSTIKAWQFFTFIVRFYHFSTIYDNSWLLTYLYRHLGRLYYKQYGPIGTIRLGELWMHKFEQTFSKFDITFQRKKSIQRYIEYLSSGINLNLFKLKPT